MVRSSQYDVIELASFLWNRLHKSGVLLCIVPLVYRTDKAFIYNLKEILAYRRGFYCKELPRYLQLYLEKTVKRGVT
jgi:hypothetical protein